MSDLVEVPITECDAYARDTVADFVASERQSRAYGLFYTLGIGSGAAAPAIVGVVSDAYGVTFAMFALAAAALATLPACVVLSSAIKRGG